MSSPPRAGVRFRAWNLLLLVPLIVLVTPLFNTKAPTLLGLPFFYWAQMAVIPIGIVCTLAVHLMTRSPDEEGTVAAVDDAAVRAADRGGPGPGGTEGTSGTSTTGAGA